MVQVTFNLAQLAAWPVSILETEIPFGHRYKPIDLFQALCAVLPHLQVPEWVLDAHSETDSVRCQTWSAVLGPRVSWWLGLSCAVVSFAFWLSCCELWSWHWAPGWFQLCPGWPNLAQATSSAIISAPGISLNSPNNERRWQSRPQKRSLRVHEIKDRNGKPLFHENIQVVYKPGPALQLSAVVTKILVWGSHPEL